MLHTPLHLGRTQQGVGAVVQRFTLLTLQGCAALRTRGGVHQRLCICRTRFHLYPHDFGNDLASFLHKHVVAHTQVEFGDLVGVVQGGAAHSGSGQKDGFQFGNGRNGAGAAYLVGDRVEAGGQLFGLELIGDGPAWALGGHAELFLLGVAVHFDDHPVDVEGKRVARGVPMLQKVQDLLDAVGAGNEAVGRLGHLKTPTAGVFQPVVVVIVGQVVRIDGVEETIQPTSGHKRRVFVFEGACRSVAGVGVQLLSCRFALGVQPFKFGVRQEDLSSDFEPLGVIAAELERDAFDGAHVFGDVLSLAAVAAGEGTNQRSVLVAQGNGHAVVLELEYVFRVGVEQLAQTGFPLGDFFGAVGVGQAQHGDLVRHLLEGVGQVAAHALGGAVGGLEFGELGFERLQLTQQGVEGLVRDFRAGFYVVQVVVVVELCRQRGHTFTGPFNIHRAQIGPRCCAPAWRT